jgi:hypothetical protein
MSHELTCLVCELPWSLSDQSPWDEHRNLVLACISKLCSAHIYIAELLKSLVVLESDLCFSCIGTALPSYCLSVESLFNVVLILFWCVGVYMFFKLSTPFCKYWFLCALSLFVKQIGAFDFVYLIQHLELMLPAPPACIIDPQLHRAWLCICIFRIDLPLHAVHAVTWFLIGKNGDMRNIHILCNKSR